MSIHQPRYSIYKQFDSLTLLSQGNMVYHGDIKETLQYFSGLGEGGRERREREGEEERREREGEEERREKGRGREEGKRGRGREGDREGQDLCMLLRLNFKTMSLFIFIILFQDIFVRNMITQLTFFLMLLTSVKDRHQLQQVILQCIHNILHNIVIHALISLSLLLYFLKIYWL